MEPQSLLSRLRNDALGDYTNAYKAVGKQSRPTLLLWGTADAEITNGMMQNVRALVPNIAFEPVEGAGHGLFVQEPAKANALVLNFLQSN